MPTPTADKLKVFFPGKKIAADNDPILTLIADAGGSLSTIVDAAVVDADGFYDGAIGFFLGDTTTVALREEFFHVRTWTLGSNTFLLTEDLPAIPVAGDTYKIIFGGNFRSNEEEFGLELGGVLPSLTPVIGSNVTGVSITYVAAKISTGDLTLDFDFSALELKIKQDTQPFGAAFVITGDAVGVVLFLDDGQSYIVVDIVQASLPGGDQSDVHTVTLPKGTYIPNFEGLETFNDVGGKSRYRLAVPKNTDLVDTMVGLNVLVARFPAARTTIDGAGIDLNAGSFDVLNGSTFPTQGFWVKNHTKDDLRYCKFRSGNTLNVFAVDWIEVAFVNGVTEPAIDDLLTQDVSGASGFVDQVFVTSGSFGGGDAAGVFRLRGFTGIWAGFDDILLSAAIIANADNSNVIGYRGKTGQTWVDTDEIDMGSNIDIALEAPATLQFSDPVNEQVEPDNLTFSDPTVTQEALVIGNTAPAGIHGVWIREIIPFDAQQRDDLIGDLFFLWT